MVAKAFGLLGSSHVDVEKLQLWFSDWKSAYKLASEKPGVDFRIHPALVVLSVIDSAQSPLVNLPASISTHGVITAARCSRRLLEARNKRMLGK
mgnify:CR=1 FL=1